MRKRIDPTQNVLIDGNFSLSNGDNDRFTEIESFYGSEKINRQINQILNQSDRLSGNTKGSYTKKLNHGKSVLKASGSFSLSQSLSESDIYTETSFVDSDNDAIRNVFQDNDTEGLSYSIAATFTQKIGSGIYLTPEVSVGNSVEDLNRKDGDQGEDKFYIMESDFREKYIWIRPKLSLKKVAVKSTISLSLQMEKGKLENTLNESSGTGDTYLYFLQLLDQ